MSKTLIIHDEFATLKVVEIINSPDSLSILLEENEGPTAHMIVTRLDALRLLNFLERVLR